MRTEYEIMARSAVNTKFRQINNYLESRTKQQEEVDNKKDNISKEIQIDLEERLQTSHSELATIKQMLKSMAKYLY